MLEIGEGAPLLFLHGGPNAASTWAPLVAHLSGFRCILVDRPGCGLSEPPASRIGSVRSYMTELVEELLGTVEDGVAGLVASSFGSYAVLAHSVVHPEINLPDRALRVPWPRARIAHTASVPAPIPAWPTRHPTAPRAAHARDRREGLPSDRSRRLDRPWPDSAGRLRLVCCPLGSHSHPRERPRLVRPCAPQGRIGRRTSSVASHLRRRSSGERTTPLAEPRSPKPWSV